MTQEEQQIKHLKEKVAEQEQFIKKKRDEILAFKKKIYDLLEEQKSAMEALNIELVERQKEIQKQKDMCTKTLQQFEGMKDRYERLNNSKLVKISRKYWAMNKSMKSKGEN
ncbi:hypothetical protein [Listeria booriae]|uniref:hypothetical protein n=1 Tax=Listeria booriae TaxID=1552123 RepID=UPI0016284A39|nr:hypothetical protein [Listeria booriae]MBC2149679.1 hypothetical protein [Listeria booriae]MBC2173882.1 hypothetical protein [Listeria booriae]MBC6301618.1 hypothetical protein [Listeria booriae]